MTSTADPALALDEPEAGAVCPSCHADLRIVGYCGVCEWRVAEEHPSAADEDGAGTLLAFAVQRPGLAGRP